MYSDFNFTKAYLMLGEACDFNCRHCLQHPSHNCFKKRPSEEAVRYLQHLADIRPRGIRRIPQEIDVVLFGGEPLLYLDAVEEVIERVGRDNVRWSMISNGARLDAATVDLLNRLHIHYAHSNDGPQTAKVRDRNLLDDPAWVELFSGVESRSICTTLHAYNQDLYALWDYLDEKVGRIPLSYEQLVVNWDMPGDIYAYDFDAWAKTCERVKETLFAAYSDSRDDLSGMREAQLFNRQIQRYFQVMEGKAEYPACGAMRNAVNLDLDGNVFLCHNGMEKFGRVERGGLYLARDAQVRFLDKRMESRKPCDECVAHPFCQEGCPFSPWSPRQAQQCRFYQILAENVLGFMRLVERHNQTEIEL